MTNLKTVISIEEALNSLYRRPGIVLGPDATRAPGELTNVLFNAMKICKINSVHNSLQDSDCRTVMDKLKHEFPAQFELLVNEFREGILKIPPSLDINHLVKAKWSACISLTEDLLFENALRVYIESIPGTRTMTIIDRLGMDPPQRTIPIYKLLGNAMTSNEESQLILSEADLLVRQQDWQILMQSFPDFVREAPVFLIGVTSCVSLTRQILGTLSAMPKPKPTKLFFLKNEGILQDPTVSKLCDRFETAIIDGSIRDLCAQIAEIKPAISTLSFPAKESESDFTQLIQKHSGIVSLVPSETSFSQATGIDMPGLVDGLFRPLSLNWKPFQENLDIRRAITDELLSSIKEIQDQAAPGHPRLLFIRGEAGVGKTTILKRLALEIAQKGIITLWCRRTSGGNWIRAFKSLAQEMSIWIKNQSGKKFQFLVICDDPWALRIDASDLISCFDRFPVPIIFIFSVRNSDHAFDNLSLLSNFNPDIDIEVPYEMVDTEISQLSTMLVRIGAFKDKESADREIRFNSSRYAKDILCSLWYMVPETRTQLTDSLRDEYWRLGSAKDAISKIVESATSQQHSSIAHSAYEFVTVTSNLGIGLPLEVLVHTLGVDYSEWLDVYGRGRPLWGLLYDEPDERNETYLYFTRNEVVTKILLDLVNGGVGHAGEMRILKRLLSACRAGSLVYRTFVLDILVRSRSKLADVLSYKQGLELFDIARETLPHEDRLIEHHRGIWMQDVGHDDNEAYRQFEHALVTNNYPGTDRDAPIEYIHTSMAASIVKLIRAGKQNAEEGAEQAREHLRQAISPRFFNYHTSHISASLFFDLANIDPSGIESFTAFANLVEAFQEIEKARQVIGSRDQLSQKNRKYFELMIDLEKRILSSIPSTKELKVLARNMFVNNKNQAGFEVCARRLFIEASQSSKGKDFNEVNEYLNECILEIKETNLIPSDELLVIKTDLLIRWRIQAFASVQWDQFRDDLSQIIKNNRYRDDVIKNFYLAVALFHCSQTTEANVLFAMLRRWQPSAFGAKQPRCYLLNHEGNPHQFQGTFKKEDRKWYFDIPELDVSVPIHGTSSYGSGSVAHAYIGFALNGPFAQEHYPDKLDFLLP